MALTSLRPIVACAALVLMLIASSTTGDVHAQRPSPAEGPWSGQAQCVVVGKWTDYLDEQTHTWRLTGEAPTPAPRGSAQAYSTWPAVWSVQGSGRKAFASREPAALGREQSERWTIAHEMKMSLRITDLGTGRLRIGAEGQRGAPLGSIRVTEVSGRTREASVQPWPFPAIEDSAANTTISGTSTKTYPEGFGVGWGQPPKAITMATCTWSFTRGGDVERSNANTPTSGGGVAGRGTLTGGPAMLPEIAKPRGRPGARAGASRANTGAGVSDLYVAFPNPAPSSVLMALTPLPFSISFGNNGPAPTSAVVVVPANFGLSKTTASCSIGYTPCLASGVDISIAQLEGGIAIPNLPPDGVGLITFYAFVHETNFLNISATITAPAGITDPNSGNNQIQRSIPIRIPAGVRP